MAKSRKEKIASYDERIAQLENQRKQEIQKMKAEEKIFMALKSRKPFVQAVFILCMNYFTVKMRSLMHRLSLLCDMDVETKNLYHGFSRQKPIPN